MIKFYNHLPSFLKEETNFKKFKNTLENILKGNLVYKLEEFSEDQITEVLILKVILLFL